MAAVDQLADQREKVSSGSLYPLLARMQRDALIEDVPPRDGAAPRRSSRAYAITPAGRRRFHDLMLDTTTSIAEYDRLFRLKVLYFQYITAGERDELIDHYQEYCRTALRHQRTETSGLRNWLDRLQVEGLERTESLTREGLLDAITVLEHSMTAWQHEYSWAEHLKRTRTTVTPAGGDAIRGFSAFARDALRPP